MLAGISEKFLKKSLKLGKDPKGVILEIKKEKDMQYAEAILYDGTLKNTDQIAIASFDKPIITKIRVLEEILPISNKFKPKNQLTAATGIRMQLIKNEDILPGMPFTIFKDNLKKISEEFSKDIGEKLKTDKQGIIIKADSLGSLEALVTMLKQEKISIISAGIGKINKKDFISAETNLREDPINALILGFNTEEDEEVKLLIKNSKIKIIKNDIIYRLIEDLTKYQEETRNEIKRQTLTNLASISKLKILHEFVFRNSNPAVFGVLVEAGKLTPRTPLMDSDGKQIAKVKSIQEQNRSVNLAEQGQQPAISLPGTMFDRQLADTNYLYSNLTENQFKKFKENKDLLSQDEIQTLQKIAQIKRKEKATWGV